MRQTKHTTYKAHYKRRLLSATLVHLGDIYFIQAANLSMSAFSELVGALSFAYQHLPEVK